MMTQTLTKVLSRIFGKPKAKEVYVYENDLVDAINHLRSLPFTQSMPHSWDRNRIMQLVRDGVGASPKVGDCSYIAPGVYAIVTFFGIDRVSVEGGELRDLEVRLAIRNGGGESLALSQHT